MDRDLDWILIIQTLYTMCGTIALVGGVILLTHSRDNRARRFHAYSMIFCCVIYFLRYSEMLSEDGDPKMVDMLKGSGSLATVASAAFPGGTIAGRAWPLSMS